MENNNDILRSDKVDGFTRNFLKFLCTNSQQFCHPTSNNIQEDEYVQCKPAFLELENFIGYSQKLSTNDTIVNSVCGKIFKAREPVYTCKDCATDNTCVFCRTCFVKSEHIKHNYQMFSSVGGGFCDCGDPEAWRTFPRCSLHGGCSNEASSSTLPIDNYDCLEDVENVTNKLTDDIKYRFLLLTEQVFEQFKSFVMRPLCKDNEEIRRAELNRELVFVKDECPDVDLDEYALVLYNNEIHNFDQVISLFKRCLPCTQEEAMGYANIVDRDGRCVALAMSVLKDIEYKQQEILSKSKAQTKVELLCRLHHPKVLAIQSFLLHTLRWLYEFANQNPLLRLVLCQYLFQDVQIADKPLLVKSTFIQDIFENHFETWKMARNACSNFLMSAVMKETYFKKLFAIQFVQNYKMIIEQFSIDDHNVQDSLVSLTCQIFTIISLAKYLLDHNNVLRIVIQLAYDELLKHSKPMICDGTEHRDILIFHKDENEMHKKFDPFERHLKSFDDVNYLLTSLLTSFTGYEGDRESESIVNQNSQQWTESCIANFIDYFRIFADILSLIQETNTIERVIEHHIEHDPQWRTGIILMYGIVPCISQTSSLIISNTACWDQAFEIFREVVIKRLVNFESKKRLIFEYSTYKANVIENNWPNKYVSVIKPLHRFMASLLLTSNYHQKLTEREVDVLFDQALQMVVFTSQQAGNMWIRNGSVPYILTQQMKCLTLSSEMFDRDIQLIQQLALCMRPQDFIVKCMHKFDLKHYFMSSSSILSEKKSLIQRVEDFLHLLIMTLFFRHRPRVGKDITTENCYEHFILHILCVKPMTHSKIMKKLPLNIQKYPKLMELIDKVADQTKQSQIVMFNAKKSLITSSFDRYSFYYSIQDRNEAEIYVRNMLKKDVGPVALFSPQPIELTEDFAGLYGYLSDPCFIRVLDRILLFCNEKRNSEYWTDAMLDMVLYLIGASLIEDSLVLDKPEQSRRPMFLETAMKPSLNIKIIDNLELLCDKITADQQLELIKWTIRKWHDVKKKMNFDRLSYEEKISEMELIKDDMEMEIETESANALHQTKMDKADVAKSRREQLMNKMKNMQKKFINENADLLTDPVNQVTQQEGFVPQNEYDLTCILCQEKSEGSFARPIVAIAGAWRSTVLAKHPFTCHSLNITESDADTLNDPEEAIPPTAHDSFPNEESDNYGGIDRIVVRTMLPILDHPEETFITTCGHVMHYDCKTRYMNDMIKHKQNIARTKGVLFPRIFNRCPLCKCVCNIDIPIIKQGDITNEGGIETMSLKEWTTFFVSWTQATKMDGLDIFYFWDKLMMKNTIPFKPNKPDASNDDLLSSLAFKVGVAIKRQPAKLNKEAYSAYETNCNSISESTITDIIKLDNAVAYTLSVWEQILSKSCLSLVTDMSERHAMGLNLLIKAVRKSHEKLSDRKYLVLLQQVLFNCTNTLYKEGYDLHRHRIPLFLLEIDFTFLVTTLLFMRSSFNEGQEHKELSKFIGMTNYNMNVVRLIFQFVSIQALLSLQVTEVDNIEVNFDQLQSNDPDLWSDEIIDGLYQLRHELSQQLPHLSMTPLTKLQMVVCFTRAMMPYLRCTSFLLMALGSIKQHQRRFENGSVEYNHLFRLLGLSMLPNTVNDLPDYLKTHLGFIGDSRALQIQSIWGTKLPHLLPHTPPKLIDLPLDFTDVLTRCLDRGCSLRQQATGAVSEMTLCLICGDTFCLNGYCCRRPEDSSLNVISGAQIHARQCHGGYSLFLNTRNSKIVVMFYQARWQIYLDPIYLDRFGESDIDLKKGNPLFLSTEAYAKLQRSWLDHSVGCIVNDGFLSNDFFV